MIKKCTEKFVNDKTKKFYVYNTLTFIDKDRLFNADLTLSLDVLFHLTETEVFETYLRHLFDAANKYVIIYATDFDQKEEAFYPHENRRRFTEFISNNINNWKVKEVLPNKYPFEKYGAKGSDCSFYVYCKV